MTTIVRLTRAELRKLATARTFLITLALSVGLAVISVIATAAAAGKNGAAALGTTASTDQMLKTGIVCCVAMLVLGIIAFWSVAPIGGSPRGYQEFLAPSAIASAAGQKRGSSVYLCSTAVDANTRFCRDR
jgi:heme/copper-type cytochrome/quinol oxidase subunit 4